MYFSRTIKCLKYCPICKLPSWPAIVSRVLAEDTILLDQKKRMLIAIAKVSLFLLGFPKPQFPRDNAKRVRWHLHMQAVALEERNPELWFPGLFIVMDSKHACPLHQRETIPIFQGCSLYKHAWKDSPEQKQWVPPPAKSAETQEPHGENLQTFLFGDCFVFSVFIWLSVYLAFWEFFSDQSKWCSNTDEGAQGIFSPASTPAGILISVSILVVQRIQSRK